MTVEGPPPKDVCVTLLLLHTLIKPAVHHILASDPLYPLSRLELPGCRWQAWLVVPVWAEQRAVVSLLELPCPRPLLGLQDQ